MGGVHVGALDAEDVNDVLVCRVVESDGSTVGQEYPGGVVGSVEDELLADEGLDEVAVAPAVLLLTPDELRLLDELTALVTALEEEPPVLLKVEVETVRV